MNHNPFESEQNYHYNLDSSTDNEEENISPQKKKEFQKLFLILLIIGLIIGIFTAWGVVKVMSNFGLTEKTNQWEKIHQNK